MCGIAGFLAPEGLTPQAGEAALAMAMAIAHRGPDDHGLWLDPEAGLALAHRRLSIVDLSPAGHQPMLSESGRHVIVFNGEIYNHGEIRQALTDANLGPNWRGHSDTEVLLAAIEAWGVERALRQSVGMFAFALWDRKERRLVLARDRLGEKPLYFGWCSGHFLFGSELKALRAHPAFAADVDRDALALLLRHADVPAPRSIFRGISKLAPASILTLHHGATAPEIATYWSVGDAAAAGQRAPFRGSPGEAADLVEAGIERALQGQMMADVPLGAFLSGGVDSSTVVALMQKLSARPVKTFTIGFQEQGYDEAAHAKAVAAHLGTDHAELYVTGREARAVIPALAHMYCEPFADSSQIPTFLVAKLARQHVTVALSGDGGDEVFSGYRRYRFASRWWPRFDRLPQGLRRAAARGVTGLGPEAIDRMARLPLALVPKGRRPALLGDKVHKAATIAGLPDLDSVYQALISQWQDPGAVVISAGPLPPVQLTGPSDPMRRMIAADMTGYLPDDILVKVDRAAMAVSLETRVPFLDHRLVELAWTLPSEILQRDGISKWPLRQVLYRYVPKALIERPKMGFGVPVGTWLRGPLRDWAEALLDERRLAREGYFAPGPIRAAWGRHLAGRANEQHALWCVLMFQAWLEARP